MSIFTGKGYIHEHMVTGEEYIHEECTQGYW